MTVSPAALAESIIASVLTLQPHCAAPVALWWLICAGMPASSAMRMTSATDSRSPLASFRMWLT